jgi:hypothetical protein
VKSVFSNALPTAFQRPSEGVCSNPPYTPMGWHPSEGGAPTTTGGGRWEGQQVLPCRAVDRRGFFSGHSHGGFSECLQLKMQAESRPS